MAGKVLPGRHDRKVIVLVIIIVLGLWTVLSFMPLIALRSGYFTLRTEDEVKRFPTLLQQFGTFGDMFSLLNCLFSGGAFVGVIYAILLQRRELHDQQEATKRAERATELQNRLAAYQNLAEHHRHEREHAEGDPLLKARSKGRVRAFAELTSGLLREAETYIRVSL
jgi:hypothetical protein